MGKIDLQLAREMVSNYATTRKGLIDQTYEIDDTASIWFSIDDVKSFVADLPGNTTGVRIYLGAYGTSYPTTPNQTSIVAVGTLDNLGSDVDIVAWPLDEVIAPSPYNTGKMCPPQCPPSLPYI